MSERRRPALPIVLLLFFVSGLAGLLHEVTWTRLLRHVMGNTTFAVTAVLGAFMGGLALGSRFGGAWIDRRRDPARVFGWFEAGIGLYCLALPFLVRASEPVYRLLHRATHDPAGGGAPVVFGVLAFAYCLILLLPPAACMGATLPVLVRWLARAPGRVGGRAGTLYAVNTLGAVVGAAATGFLLLPALGVSATIVLGSGLNLAIGVTALARFRGDREPVAPEPPVPGSAGPDSPAVPEASASGRRLLPAGYALAGFASLVYEVAWTRVLALIVGSSVYAFSLMLIAFIAGLGLGSLVFAPLTDRLRRPWLALGGIELAVAAAAAAVVPLFGILPYHVTGWVSRAAGSFWRMQATELALLLAVMLPATLLMGATFPLASRLATAGGGAVGRSIGTVYASNTLGAIAGAFAAGFLLIPWVGTQLAILIAVLVNVAAAAAFLLADPRRPRRGRLALVAGAVVLAGLALFAMPAWNPAAISFGPYVQGLRLEADVARDPRAVERAATDSEVVFHREGLTTTVTVRRFPNDVRYLYVNGKIDASSFGNLPTQKLLAHLPLLLHRAPRRVLQVGLASGITLGSAGLHPLERLDCVELSRAVVEATRFFDSENHRILNDPRVRVVVADGRHHLALSDERYDVIVSQPSNPWIAGVADLFTEEFFRLCRRRLREGGIACVWLESSAIDEPAFRSVVATFREVFGHGTLWSPAGSRDFLLIGSPDGRLQPDLPQLERRLQATPLAEDLESVGVTAPVDLLGQLVLGEEEARRFAEGAPLHTDDNGLVEFSAPRARVAGDGGRSLRRAIERYRGAELAFLGEGPDNLRLRQETARRIEAHGLFLGARSAAEEGRAGLAAELYEKTLAIHPGHAKAHNNLGALRAAAGRLDAAIEHFRRAAALDPRDAGAWHNLGRALVLDGRPDEAQRPLRAAIQLQPDWPAPLTTLARILAEHPDRSRRNPEEAVRLAQHAVDVTQGRNRTALQALAAAQAAASGTETTEERPRGQVSVER